MNYLSKDARLLVATAMDVADGLQDILDAGEGASTPVVTVEVNSYILTVNVGCARVWDSEEDDAEDLAVDFCWQEFLWFVADLNMATNWELPDECKEGGDEVQS